MEPPTPFPEFAGLTADDRARSLLLSMLTKAEREQFQQYQYVEVIAKSGRRYWLHATGAVFLMLGKSGSDTVKANLCVYPYEIDGTVPPVPDRILAHMLHIKADEIHFLKIARGHNERV